jgi:uncharacterized protein (TIGR03437 family)
VTPGAECPPHAPFHSPGAAAETEAESLFSLGQLTEAPLFAAGLNQDGTFNGGGSGPLRGLNGTLGANAEATSLPGTKVRPAKRGTVVQLFGSAEGLFLEESDARAALEFTPPVSGSPLFYTSSLPEVRIGGVAAKVLFSGLAPGLKGVWQINVLIPDGAPAGSAPVIIHYDGNEVTSVGLAIQ